MKTLYELGRLNSRHIKVFEALIPQDDNSPIKKLASIVFSESNLGDKECMIEIYGKKNLTAFSRLKTRLKDILIRVLIMQNINTESADARVNEALSGYRQSLISRILITRKSGKLAVEIAEKSITRSMKYHATENVLIQAHQLVGYYGSTELNKYKLTKYLEIQEKFMNIYLWEIKAENYFFDLQRAQLQSLANPNEETKSKAYKYAMELENVKGIRTYFFNYNKYRVLAAHYEFQKDFNSLLELSEKAQKEFSVPDFKTGTALASISNRRAWALIQAGRPKETAVIGLKGLNKQISGSLNWYILAHYTLKAQLYIGDYNKAIDLISQMIGHPRFDNIGDNFKEVFFTTLGYIHLLAGSGIIGDSPELIKKLPEFKLGKFLNTTPVFSKDKRGINVSILLMHIAFLLQRKDYNSIIDRIDSLNQYAYRYLRKDDSFRSNCMIKMVIQMTKADFNPIRTARYTADLRKQLSQVTLAGSGENIEVEIIPFEVLWDIMTKAL